MEIFTTEFQSEFKKVQTGSGRSLPREIIKLTRFLQKFISEIRGDVSSRDFPYLTTYQGH
jgi:hypothetical protein